MKTKLILSLLFVGSTVMGADAGNSVRIICGGPTSVQKFETIRKTVEKDTGLELVLTTNPNAVAMSAVSRGIADGSTGPIQDALDVLASKGSILKASDFQTLDFSKGQVHIGVHPNNPVANLTKDQISDILSGKIKNWQSLNSKNIPVTVYLARDYSGALQSINQVYLDGRPSPVANVLSDKTGLLKAIKRDEGAIAFFTAKQKLDEFEPKFFTTDVTYINHLIMLKKARPPAQKLFDYLQAHAELLK